MNLKKIIKEEVSKAHLLDYLQNAVKYFDSNNDDDLASKYYRFIIEMIKRNYSYGTYGNVEDETLKIINKNPDADYYDMFLKLYDPNTSKVRAIIELGMSYDHPDVFDIVK